MPVRSELSAIAELARLGRLLVDHRDQIDNLTKSLIAWYCRHFHWPTGRLSVIQDGLPRGISFTRDTPIARYLASVAIDEVALDRLQLWEDLIAFRTPMVHRTIPENLHPKTAGSVLGVPVILNDEVAGVLEFFSDEIRNPGETEFDAARFLSWLLVQALRAAPGRTWDRRGDPALRNAMDQAPVAVALIDSRTLAIARINPGFLRLLGRTRDEVVGRPLSRFLHREDLSSLGALVAGHAKGDLSRRELRFVRQDGRYLWIRAVMNSPGRRVGPDSLTMFMGEDVTEEKKISKVLHDVEARHEAAMEASKDSFFLISADGTLRDGRGRLNGPSTRLEDAFAPDVADAYRLECALALETGRVREFTYLLPHIHGNREQSVRIVAAGESEVLAVVRDVTGTRHMERRLQEADDRQRRKLGQAIHDGLGQDLTGIALKCSALAKRLSRASSAEAAEVRQIEKLVQNALASSRAIARGLCPVGLEGCGLAEHLRKMVRQVRQTFGISCTLDWSPDLTDSTGAHVTELYWIFHEAITNALRHGAPRSIAITATPEGSGARFRIWNDGRPLDENRNGEGLGLEIIRARAHSVGATVSIANSPGGGVEVLCSIPMWGPEPLSPDNALPRGGPQSLTTGAG